MWVPLRVALWTCAFHGGDPSSATWWESTFQTPNSRILWWWFSKSYSNQVMCFFFGMWGFRWFVDLYIFLWHVFNWNFASQTEHGHHPVVTWTNAFEPPTPLIQVVSGDLERCGTGPQTEKVCPPLDTSQLTVSLYESDDDKEDESSPYALTELPVPSPDVVTDLILFLRGFFAKNGVVSEKICGLMAPKGPWLLRLFFAHEILPSYMGIQICRCKDPYFKQPIEWKVRVFFFFVAQVVLKDFVQATSQLKLCS